MVKYIRHSGRSNKYKGLKSMKIYIIPLIYSCLLLTLLGCDNKQSDSKTIINNYINNGQYDVAPHSKLIKKQRFEGSYFGTIETNADGLITFYNLNDKKVYFDYQQSQYMIKNQELSKYKINVDDKQNIVSITDSSGNEVIRSTYDEQGRVVKLENSIIGGSNYLFINQITYKNELVVERDYEIFDKTDEANIVPLYLNKKQYFYNTEKQLINSVEHAFIAQNGQYESNEHNQLIPTEQLNCVYDDPNQYGDWTKLYCLNEQEETKRFILRSFEYYD